MVISKHYYFIVITTSLWFILLRLSFHGQFIADHIRSKASVIKNIRLYSSSSGALVNLRMYTLLL